MYIKKCSRSLPKEEIIGREEIKQCRGKSKRHEYGTYPI